MKKVVLFAVMSAFVFALSSCKKDWTCECRTSDSSTPSGILSPTWQDITKADAKKSCDQLETNYKIISQSVSCELK